MDKEKNVVLSGVDRKLIFEPLISCSWKGNKAELKLNSGVEWKRHHFLKLNTVGLERDFRPWDPLGIFGPMWFVQYRSPSERAC